MWPNVYQSLKKNHRTVLLYVSLPKFVLDDTLEVYKIKIHKSLI